MAISFDEELEPMLTENGSVTRIKSQERRCCVSRVCYSLPDIRWYLVLLMQGIIIFILMQRAPHYEKLPLHVPAPGDDINGIIPKLPYTIQRFEPHLQEFTANYTSAEQSRAVRERWTELFPLGGGTVRIDDHKKYEFLSVPFSNPDKTLGPLYQVSWTHQLHCLYYLMDAYDKLVQNGPLGSESALPEGHHSVHTNHCFDYLRQAIICNADMTLEGGVPGEEKGTDGFGHAHICRDHSKVVEWVEGKRINDEIKF